MRNAPQSSVSTAAAEAATPDANVTAGMLPALIATARYHGIELDPKDLSPNDGSSLSVASLVEWVRATGLWVKPAKLTWLQLTKAEFASPIVLLLDDGTAAMATAADLPANVVYLHDPAGRADDPPVPVDALQMRRHWSGATLLIRSRREVLESDKPFTIGWLARLVSKERRTLRDVFLASLTLSVLTILPPLVVMTVIDRVITHESLPTLVMVSAMIGVAVIYESCLGFARRQMTSIVGARVDAKLNLHVFRRLLGLPLDYFEREQAGAIIHNTMQVNKVRDFLTGKLLSTSLDLVNLLVLLPVLFVLQPILTWLVVGSAVLIALIILGFLHPMRRAVSAWIEAETKKSSVLVESIQGIRTIKSLGLEPQQRELWDNRSAEATRLKLASSHLSNWPHTLVTPLEGFMQRGVLLLGAYLAIQPGSSVQAGSLVAFMMLSGRVAQPLTSLARLMEDLEEVRTAIRLAGKVLNKPQETIDPTSGLRPRLEGAITFDKVAYRYPNSSGRVLNEVTFEIPQGSTLGLVGRSGSGKSTITRLLQGISRDYEGIIKIDGYDIKQINLAHMRRSFGVVLQENFLFRGTIRANILACRPHLTLSDAILAARLAGAEEFIERLPNGYETWIEEGSPNLSGGQRQRLAIARALVHDPRLLILDEATSSLDPESEAVVNANLARIGRGRTMVIVSHRLSSLMNCDQILVLDQGCVIDIAPHATLLDRCDIYRQLWVQQNHHVGVPEKAVVRHAARAQGGK